MAVRFSHILALTVALGLGIYMWSGAVVIGGQASNNPPAIADRKQQSDGELFAVAVERLSAEDRSASLEIRGRTEAEAKVEVRSETTGIVRERAVEKGQLVSKGDLLCVLDDGSREARVAQAQAQLTQAQIDLDANAQLSEKGFAAKNRLPALRAALDAAKAAVAEAEIELGRTRITAPIDGVVQDPLVNEGDLLSAGATCATLVDRDPMKVIGQVGEREVGALREGMKADIRLISAEQLEGAVSYIAPSADPQTRTFRVEIAVPNPDGTIRDGVTATARIALPEAKAHRLAASVLTLSDDGTVGVRTVDDAGVVRFREVDVLGTAGSGVWVAGLEDEVTVITVGQDYVVDGERVRAVARKDTLAESSR